MAVSKYWIVFAFGLFHYGGSLLQSQMCPDGGKEFLPHYSNCSLFFECNGGIKTLNSCPDNFTWSFWEQKCVFKDYTDCSYTTLVPPTTTKPVQTTPTLDDICPNWGQSYLPDYGDCHFYYECYYGEKTHVQCPQGKAWSLPEDACLLEMDVDCSYTTPGSVTDTPGPGGCPPRGSSYMPNYIDCKSFYICENGKGTLRQCFDGYAWNAELEACDLIENVDCSYTTLSPNPTTATTPNTKPTTISPTPPETTIPSTMITTPSTTTQSGSTTTPGTLCEGQKNGAYLPDPYDCTKFIMCLDGIPSIYSCPDGESWDQNKKQCDDNNEENCKNSTVIPTTITSTTSVRTTSTTISPSPLCEGQKNGAYVPDLYDCTKFIMCFDGIANINSCPNGQSWNQNHKQCDNNNEENCNKSTAIPTTTSTAMTTPSTSISTTPTWVDPICENDDPNVPTYHPHPYNCTLFYECINRTTILMSCQDGYEWSASENKCDLKDNVDCSYTSPMPSSTEVTVGYICEVADDGFKFEHPTYCEKYILCLNHIALTKLCPNKTSWDPETETCNNNHEYCSK